jgi:hypothetical protein
MRGVETQWNMFVQGSYLALLCYCRMFKARLQQIQAQCHASQNATQITLRFAFSFITDSGTECIYKVPPEIL